jgi:serine/threonine-protein kinase PknG
MEAIDGGLADRSLQETAGVLAALTHARIALGLDAGPVIGRLEHLDPWDWRLSWYRGLHALSTGAPAAAAEHFSAAWTELPGELAPRLGVAMAAEQAGEHARAAQVYERVASVDSTYVSAAFGLARCRAALGDRPGAVQAYHLVPSSSATYNDAQVASARALVGTGGDPDPADLVAAASTVERLQLDAVERASLSAEILERALEATLQGRLRPAAGTTLLGHRIDEPGLRVGLEAAYRELARLSDAPLEKYRLVDRANAVRPRTLV